jgi:hypothetical protein
MRLLLCLGAVFACLVCALPAFAWPGCEVDRIHAEVSGSPVTIFHDATAYNCCVDGFDYTVDVQGTEILVSEFEVVTLPCVCLCCYDLSVEIEDLAPGEYSLSFTWYDYDTIQWEMWSDLIVVPDVGQGGAATVASSTNSGCLDPNAGPEPGVECSAWGKVKAAYR